MATRKKFYAIAVGASPGIYDNWPDAHAQVKGFAGAKYKGFLTRHEAELWLNDPGRSRASAKDKGAKKTSSSATDTSPKAGEVTIYTDGGARFNPGPGGYGVVQIYNGETKELSGGYQHTTNNRMELMGCIVALQELEYRDKPVVLYSDSQYVVNGITKGWAKGWRKRGWLKFDKQPAVNPDLWEKLLDLVEGLKISFRWVKGHAGHPQNERCDELAVAWSGKKDLPVDIGYKGNNNNGQKKR
jgi:ribonuclease HI